MARRRPSRGFSASKKNKQLKQLLQRSTFQVEELEERLQFVVLHGGDVFQFSGGVAGGGGGGTGGNAAYERVVVTGNTTVELVGAMVDTTSGQLQTASNGGLTGMDGIITQGPDRGVVGAGYLAKVTSPTPTFVETLYAIYVVQSDSTSGIAIATITDPTTPGPHPMQPYTGQASLRISPTAVSNPVFATYVVSGPGGGGANILGAVTFNPSNQGGGGGGGNVTGVDDIPILSATVSGGQFTFVPAGTLAPGFYVTSGNFGSFLYSGVITGNVVIHGSINQFYAGWIVTGNSAGESDTGIVTVPDNFQVDGDMRDLVTPGSIGTDDSNNGLLATGTPRYASGLDMHVGGKISQINTQGNWVGSLTINNNNPAQGLPSGMPETEQELRFPNNADPWSQGLLGNATFLNNDTFATPQYVGTTDASGNITISGELQADPINQDFVDYYAVPLLAGQTVTVQVVEPPPVVIPGLPPVPPPPPTLDAGVFDPDNRLIATDYNRVDPTQTREQPFQFTATEPGVYRFAVAESGNNNFDANGGANRTLADFPYTLTIKNVGNLAVGGLVASGIFFDNAPNGAFGNTGSTPIDAIHVVNGDLGAVFGGTSVISYWSATPFNVFSYGVDNGNLRAVVGGQIGAPTFAQTQFFLSPAPRVAGTIGLLEATTGALSWNVWVVAGQSLTQAQSAAAAIGGDYQWVNAPTGTFLGDLIADGNIGTVQALAMNNPDGAGYFQVNATYNPALHGTIDLIDSTGDIGTVQTGGPGIVTGPAGNVRYIHVGSQATIYRDVFFGGGSPNETLYQPGETATITDDSGTVVNLTPVGGLNPQVTTTGGGTGTGTGTGTGSGSGSGSGSGAGSAGGPPGTSITYSAPASLTVLTYPIRGSGGAAIVRVTSDDGVNLVASGSDGQQSAEIGTIEVHGGGTVVANPGAGTGTGTGTGTSQFPGAGQPGGPPIKNRTASAGLPYILPTTPASPSLTVSVPLNISLSGSVKLDTFEITGQPLRPGDGSLVPGIGNVTSLTNNTGGEMVNLHFNSLGSVSSSGVVGVAADHNTAAAVQGMIHNPLSEDSGTLGEPWTYPLLLPTSMVRVLGNIQSISAAGLGNIYAGIISMTPGADPFAPGTSYEVPASGSSLSLTSVAGNVGSISAQVLAPIVTAGSISSVTAQGGFTPHGSGAVGGAGLYAVGAVGPVVSNGDMAGEIVSRTSIASVTVNNGTIIDGGIGTLTRFDYIEHRALSGVIVGNISPITRPQLDLGPITVNGNGGIIGSEILSNHTGPIKVADTGFGIFDSLIATNGNGTLAGITVGGYGIRDGIIEVGASTGPIVVHGNGQSVPVTNFPASVRQSETGAQFTSSGQPISFVNDIDAFLGTNASTPQVIGVTDTGVIEDVTLTGSRDLASVTAYSIRGRDLSTLTSVVTGFSPTATPSTTTFNIANRLGTLTVTGPVNGFNLTTGRSTKYTFGGDVSNLDMTIAGPVGNLVMKSSLDGTSSINAIGPSGHINSLTIMGNLAGTVHSQTYIQNLHVLGTITGTVDAARIGTIHLSGGVGSGGLTINGPLNQLIVDTSFGPGGNPIQVNGNANIIKINGDLAANINVTGKLQQLNVGGSILTGSTTSIGGVLNLLKVGGDIQAGATVHAQLVKRQIVKGQVLGTILTP